MLSRIPRTKGDAWPPDLFFEAETELDNILRGVYMPQFMDHSVFEQVLLVLGNYEAELLFPPDRLESAESDLVKALEGDLSVTCMLRA